MFFSFSPPPSSHTLLLCPCVHHRWRCLNFLWFLSFSLPPWQVIKHAEVCANRHCERECTQWGEKEWWEKKKKQTGKQFRHSRYLNPWTLSSELRALTARPQRLALVFYLILLLRGFHACFASSCPSPWPRPTRRSITCPTTPSSWPPTSASCDTDQVDQWVSFWCNLCLKTRWSFAAKIKILLFWWFFKNPPRWIMPLRKMDWLSHALTLSATALAHCDLQLQRNWNLSMPTKSCLESCCWSKKAQIFALQLIEFQVLAPSPSFVYQIFYFCLSLQEFFFICIMLKNQSYVFITSTLIDQIIKI